MLKPSLRTGSCASTRPSRLVICKPAFTARRVAAKASSTPPPPSYATSSNELHLLSQLSNIVQDGFGGEQERAAATVSYGLLVGIIKSEQLGYKPLENCIAAARTYSNDIDVQVAKAFANVGALLAERVTGRVSTELDPRLADDKDGLVKRADLLANLYNDMGVNVEEKVLFRVPATYAGLQATAELEREGLACHQYMVYSLIQAAAAAEAGASVINPNVGRTRDWFRKNPNAIRDPKGPRQDAGLGEGIDVGITLATQIYNYCKVHHPEVSCLATGIRSREDALALAGYDFLVLPPPVMEKMAATATMSGYNDGLRANEPTEDGPLPRAVSPEMAKSAAPEKMDTKEAMSSKESFEEALGLSGRELLQAGIASAIADVRALAGMTRATSGME